MNKITIFTFCIFLSACTGVQKSSRIATISEVKGEYRYEIEIAYIHPVNGKRCNSNFEICEVTERNWIYVNSLTGTIESGTLVLMHGPNKSLWRQSNLKGQIVFSSNILIVNFELPNYGKNDVIEKYVPFEFNGQYKIKYEEQ